MSNQWFRMYAEFATDPKVQMLDEAMQRRLAMLFCLRCNGSETLQDSEVTFLLRIDAQSWAATKAEFIARGFIDSSNNVLNWDKRQYRSDSSSERVRKHRATKKQGIETECNVSVTPPEQNRTDTEHKEKKVVGTRFALQDPPADWIQFCLTTRPDLDPGGTFDGFRDYWIAKPGKEGTKLDWQATWRNWVRNQNQKGASNAQPAKSKFQIGLDGIAAARAKRLAAEQGSSG